LKAKILTYIHVTVHRNKFLYNNTSQMHQFPKFTSTLNSPCFGQFLCPSSGVYLLYTRHWYMSYKFVDIFRAGANFTRSALFWDLTQLRVVIPYQTLGPIIKGHFVSSILVLLDPFPETSIPSYHFKLRKIREESRSTLLVHRGGSLISYTTHQ
jgi:hypothetical protein